MTLIKINNALNHEDIYNYKYAATVAMQETFKGRMQPFAAKHKTNMVC